MADGSELKDELAVLVQHVQRFFIEDCRPWAEFFGPVSQPKWTQTEVKKRVTANVTFFATNYLLICALFSAFYILRSPGLLVTLMVSLSMFVYVFMSRRKPLVVFDVSLGTREKMIGALAASTLLLSVTGYIFSIQYSVIFGSTLCLLHATFRPPVARAVRNSRNFEPELHGGDGDVEGGVGAGSGSGGAIGRGRVNANVNPNIRLRTRPPVGGGMGMTMSPRLGIGASGGFHESMPPVGDVGNPRLHSHAT